MDDLVRRNDVYNALDEWFSDKYVDVGLYTLIDNIPSIEPQSMMRGCDDCKYETYPDFYYPCCDCKNNYVDKWQMKEGENDV